MNKTLTEAKEFIRDFDSFFSKSADKISNDLDFAIAPSFSSLTAILESKVERLQLAAQDVSQFQSGSYTGEVSAKMLKDLSVNFVIIGHSERRMFLKETNEDLIYKVDQAQTNGLIPIFCVGESFLEFESHKTESVIISQINAIKHILNFEKVIIAYEPIWAIGTGKTATPEIADNVCSLIKSNFGENLKVVYGGSVNSENVAKFLSKKSIDGVLVGGASLDPKEFVKILINS
ncbi:triose-phosphate isomerase [Mycoplasma sp. 'Moose RK']|uniref:triose-phosphate isomerase n=1 Tax=Mycoplasma sp. 'Moose RK' TaxID=2780095 RepID=UPI001E5E43B0